MRLLLGVALYAAVACSERAIPRPASPPAVARGLALMEHTGDSLPKFVRANLRCTSCHLDRGTRLSAAPLIGARQHYPSVMARAGRSVSFEERVNFCFTRSLAGRPLAVESGQMQAIVAYLTSIARENAGKTGLANMPPLTGDSARGQGVYVANCARCHGGTGEGNAAVPALWGPRSFAIGASMARVERAASFVRHNMPLDRPGSLTDQQAFDVAAYLNSHPRPDSPGKEQDWPKGGAPVDVPYATAGRTAHSPPLLPAW